MMEICYNIFTMKNYIILQMNGSQYLTYEGEELDIDKIKGKEGETIKIKDVLLAKTDGKVKIGQPTLSKSRVEAKIIKHFQGNKIRVATYRAKSRYRRVKGFRPQLTRIKITKIES
ncbi:50S ribosomal protein L21 [Candidatus Shapirobacteria bacterium CG09_land_8_20_14_0_10_38_17]|uniref:Large ribosomal subunit protein bL21 n=1 Tax=Candidatus Shapirobacteria bacterium CG09_land_8_20_14_0_10_38_17 TaxID=1974884 RepID=A0A2H0WRX3_9BACT|nr:MAG: 50S ribosomal protein L21 [Candidatus Shapirobacteria bacterium CG09_land_8_20_14_0_10_38_17]